jgi:hypothetical protein
LYADLDFCIHIQPNTMKTMKSLMAVAALALATLISGCARFADGMARTASVMPYQQNQTYHFQRYGEIPEMPSFGDTVLVPQD